jgi:CPA2 family monovalent cation:H+ antiporter-2
MSDIQHEYSIYPVIFLAAAVLVVPIFRKLKLNPVLGYMVAGIAIGPHVLGLINNPDEFAFVAELGVIFLLFIVGLELSLERLVQMRSQIFIFGTAQVMITGSVIWGSLTYLGVRPDTAFLIGAALALSSTAVALEVIAEQKREASQVGRLTLAALLFQDLIFIPLMIVIPLLGGSDSNSMLESIFLALMRSAFAIALIFIVGRVVIHPIFRILGSPNDSSTFASLALLIVLGSAWVTNHFGLSFALGAFMAGLLVAETEYRHQVRADILPFKSIFIGIFFTSIGMIVDIPMILEKLHDVLTYTMLLIIFKAAIVLVICKFLRYRLSQSIETGLLLAQGSELAFICFTLGKQQGLIDAPTTQILHVVVALSMALTPLLAYFGRNLAVWLDQKLAKDNKTSLVAETRDLEGHVIIAGFGRVGQTIARLLQEEQIRYVALDTDPKRVSEGREKGHSIYYGDFSRLDVLNAIGISRATALIVTVDDLRPASRGVARIKQAHPELPVIARARDKSYAERLQKFGADIVVPETFEGSLQLGAALLRKVGTSEGEVLRLVEKFRAERYALTKAISAAPEETADKA